MSKHVTVYKAMPKKPRCPHCRSAKSLLRQWAYWASFITDCPRIIDVEMRMLGRLTKYYLQEDK